MTAREAAPARRAQAVPRDEVASLRRGSTGQQIRASLVAGASWLACRLPEGLADRLADVAGTLWYRAAPARAALVRRNLERVSRALADRGLGGEAMRAAASDAAARERLVRRVFREGARYYLDVLRLPLLTPALVRDRLLVERPELVDQAFGPAGPSIFVGMHFGAVELPAVYLAERSGVRAAVPMETVGDPELQRWFVQTRGRLGVRIVGIREARRELLASLRRGEPVGIVGDRDLTGGGIAVPFFGAPAPLPIGPALLAIEAGAPLFAVAVRRAGDGRYVGGVREVEIPSSGSRRERLTAALAATARAFEESIATAPEQWWGLSFPIWPDLAGRPRGER